MNPQELELLTGILRDTADAAWTIALVAVYAGAISRMLWAVGFFFATGVLGWQSWVLRRKIKSQDICKTCDDCDGNRLFVMVILSVVTAVLFLITVGVLSGGVARLAAPEWYAFLLLKCEVLGNCVQ